MRVLVVTFIWISLFIMSCLHPLFAKEVTNIVTSTSTSAAVNDFSKDIKIRDIMESPGDYSYSSMDRPNPFVPPLISSLIASEEISIVSLLQKYSLEKLNVVGVWRLENGKSKALIMTPKDEGVVVTTGDSLGRRGGKIVKIDDDKVIVREFSLASDGTRQFEDQQIWLGAQKPEEQEKSIRMRSQVLGLPNWFGYGSKNYLESDDFSEKRKNLLENNKLDLAPKVKGKEDSGKSENSDQSPEEDLPNKPADDLQKEEGHK